jgi:hypothetical protein
MQAYIGQEIVYLGEVIVGVAIYLTADGWICCRQGGVIAEFPAKLCSWHGGSCSDA